MNSLIRSIFSRRLVFCIGALLCAMLINGCGGGSIARLEIQPSLSPNPVIQDFPHAYLAVSQDGDQDIVLVSEGLIPSQTRNHILEPAKIDPMKQIVHIHLLWRPLPGARSDQPISTNATIDWYVMSNMPGFENDRIVYRGAGFVASYPYSGGARIVIRNATLKLAQQSGDLVDPFGPSIITGAFDVQRNDGMVSDTLASLAAPPRPLPTTSPTTDESGPQVPAPTLPPLQ